MARKFINKNKNIFKIKVYKENINNNNVLILDNIGVLSNVYKYGELAYIGGGFNAGIHNILEAAAFGLPIIFGPNYQKFKEAKDLIALKGAKSITNYSELESTINSFNNHERSININYIKHNSGATIKILEKL